MTLVTHQSWLLFFVPAPFVAAHKARSVFFDIVLACMFALGQNVKIFWAVIVSLAIFMMNLFARLKCATIRLFPDNAMLWNVTFAVSAWITGHIEQYVAAIINSSTDPSRIIFTQSLSRVVRKARHWMANEIPALSACFLRYSRWLPAPTLAKSRWYFFGLRDVVILTPYDSCQAIRSRVVSGQKSGLNIFVIPLGRDFSAASASASFIFHRSLIAQAVTAV